jgi:RHS repeat-associated protein
MTRPNGVNTNYSYDSLSRLLSVLHQAGASTIDGASYTVDATGNRTSKTDQMAGVTSNYSYDALYELKQVTQAANATENYTYDPVGNRLSSLTAATMSYNSSNELTATPSTSYTYDANGNTTSKTDSTGTTSYASDFENRLTSVTLPGTGGTVSFKYDPLGRRIQKQFTQGTSTTTTNYVYTGNSIAEQTDAAANVIARYAQGEGIDEPLAQQQSGAINYYNSDGLGSVTSLSNASGAVAQTYTYDSFGKLLGSTGALVNAFQYTGREFDPETGLYYYRARYYDPNTGKFLSEDPMGFGAGVDFYVYASNSPNTLNDPLGLQGILGNNPFPKIAGNDLAVFNNALSDAKEAACNSKCDGALQSYGIKSLLALVSQMTPNVNVYDGRKSTYPYGKQTVAQFLAQGTAAAVAFTDVKLTYLGEYFWNPSSIDNMAYQRALILLHEAVHEFGFKDDKTFGGSMQLTEKIAEKCFPVLKALKKLGNLTN